MVWIVDAVQSASAPSAGWHCPKGFYVKMLLTLQKYAFLCHGSDCDMAPHMGLDYVPNTSLGNLQCTCQLVAIARTGNHAAFMLCPLGVVGMSGFFTS